MGVVALAALAAIAMMVGAEHVVEAGRADRRPCPGAAPHSGRLDWARAVLSDDRRSNSVDHLGEPWALRLPPMPVDKGELSGYIEDQHGQQAPEVSELREVHLSTLTKC